jgi:hypothetical protein
MTPDTRDIAPAPHARVRHENGRLLDDAGETVTWSTHWQRRLDDGDIVALAETRTPPPARGRSTQEKDA